MPIPTKKSPDNPEPQEERRFKRRKPDNIVPGMFDSLPERYAYVDWINFQVESVAITHELGRIDLPIIEKVAVFNNALGEDSDIASSQIWRISGRGGEAVGLRPDVRPGLARAFAQDKFSGKEKPIKLWHSGPLFRMLTPSAGVFRQFNVFGFELVGEKNPVLDAQVIQMAWKIIQRLKLADMIINVNSVGCHECRPDYLQNLKEYYESRQHTLCKKCRKLRTENPLRLLACEEEKCVRLAKEAPQILDHLCEACHEHFSAVLEYSDDLEIPYSLNPQLVHDQEYYTRTVFAIWHDKADRSKAIFSGGRYDDLIEKMGGRPTRAVGITGGIDRLVLAMQEQGLKVPARKRADVYLAQLSTMAKKKALKVFEELQDNGVRVVESFGKNAVTTQIEQATKIGVPITLILGQKEVLDDTIILRDMINGVQEIVALNKVVAEVKKRTE